MAVKGRVKMADETADKEVNEVATVVVDLAAMMVVGLVAVVRGEGMVGTRTATIYLLHQVELEGAADMGTVEGSVVAAKVVAREVGEVG